MSEQPAPISPSSMGIGYAFIAMIGTAMAIGIGLAVALHGVYGLDGLGPILWAMAAALVGLPTAGIAGFLYGRQKGQLAQMERLMEEAAEPLEPSERAEPSE